MMFMGCLSPITIDNMQHGLAILYVTVSAKTLHVRVQILAYYSRFEIS